MRNKKIIDKEMNSLYDNLVRKKTPTVDDAIYLSDGLYLLPNGDIIEKQYWPCQAIESNLSKNRIFVMEYPYSFFSFYKTL